MVKEAKYIIKISLFELKTVVTKSLFLIMFIYLVIENVFIKNSQLSQLLVDLLEGDAQHRWKTLGNMQLDHVRICHVNKA